MCVHWIWRHRHCSGQFESFSPARIIIDKDCIIWYCKAIGSPADDVYNVLYEPLLDKCWTTASLQKISGGLFSICYLKQDINSVEQRQEVLQQWVHFAGCECNYLYRYWNTSRQRLHVIRQSRNAQNSVVDFVCGMPVNTTGVAADPK